MNSTAPLHLHPPLGPGLVQFFRSAKQGLEQFFRHKERYASRSASAEANPQLLQAEFVLHSLNLALNQLEETFGALEADIPWDALDEQHIELAETLHPLFLVLADLLNEHTGELGPISSLLEPINAWEQRLELLSKPDLRETFQQLAKGQAIHPSDELVEWKEGMLTW